MNYNASGIMTVGHSRYFCWTLEILQGSVDYWIVFRCGPDCTVGRRDNVGESRSVFEEIAAVTTVFIYGGECNHSSWIHP